MELHTLTLATHTYMLPFLWSWLVGWSQVCLCWWWSCCLCLSKWLQLGAVSPSHLSPPSHKAQCHIKHRVIQRIQVHLTQRRSQTGTIQSTPHTKHTVTQAPYKVHHHRRHSHTCPPSHKAQSHMHTITQGTVTPSHKAQDHTRHTSRLTIRDNLT